MKLLIVNRHRDDTVGGSEIQCDLIARYLHARGHAVTYAVMDPRRGAYSVPYESVPLTAPAALSFGRLVRRRRPDVVYWRFNKPGLLACALQARLAGAKVLFALSHDEDTRFWTPLRIRADPGAPAWRRTARYARAWWRRLEDCVDHAGHRLVHGHVAQHADQAAGLPPATTRVIRSSVLEDREPFEHERAYVVWVANVKPRKRPERFVELARALADEPVDFLAVGALQDPAFAWLARPDRVPPSFRFLGERSPAQVNGIIASSLFLVLTCEPEGFPNVLMQAWNQARPALALGYDPETRRG